VCRQGFSFDYPETSFLELLVARPSIL
jgi:hypothetical protein